MLSTAVIRVRLVIGTVSYEVKHKSKLQQLRIDILTTSVVLVQFSTLQQFCMV